MWGQARLVLTSPNPESRDAVPQGRGSAGRIRGPCSAGNERRKGGNARQECGMRDALPRQPFLLHLLPPSPRSCGGMRGRGAGFGMWDSGFGMRGGIGLRMPPSAAPRRSRWSGNAPAGSRRTAQPGGRRAEGTALFSSGNPEAESCTAFIFSWKADACGVGMRERGKIPHVYPCSVFHFKRSGSSRSSDPGQAGLSVGDGSHRSIFLQRLLPPGRKA